MKSCLTILLLFTHLFVYPQQSGRFMVVGDMHHYSPSPDLTGTILYELGMAAIEEEVDFIFFVGDLIVSNFSSPEQEEQQLRDWRFLLDTLNYHAIKMYACRGNNDVSSIDAWNLLFSGEYSFPQNGPEGEKNLTYAIVYDNLLFLSLDMYTNYHRINQDWLDEILLAQPRVHIFAAGHESAFKVGQPATMNTYPTDRDKFWESLISAGAKVYFCGHDHFYDHARIDDGDGNPGNDIHQVIVGTGRTSFHSDGEYNGTNGRWTPIRIHHEENAGYVLIELSGEEAQLTWKHRIAQHIFGEGGDSWSFLEPVGVKHNNSGNEFDLKVYPNPCRDETIFSCHVPDACHIQLVVCDLLGRKITGITDSYVLPGSYSFGWNTKDLKPGIYLFRLLTNDQIEQSLQVVSR